MCQCPKSGEVHFYDSVIQMLCGRIACVNALNRAKFISTFKDASSVWKAHDLCQCPKSGEVHFYSSSRNWMTFQMIVSMP